MGEFYGVPNVQFIWHGEWSDPEVEYKGHVFNYYTVEDWLLDEYHAYCEEVNEPEDDDDGFKKFVGYSHNLVYEILDYLIETDDCE